MGVLHEDRIQDRTGYAYKSSKRSAPERVRNLSCFRFPSAEIEHPIRAVLQEERQCARKGGTGRIQQRHFA